MRAAELLAQAGSGRARVDPGRRGLVALAAVAVLVAVLAGGWLLASRPHQLPVSAAVQPPSGTGSGPADHPSPTGSVSPSTLPGPVVDVAGKVRHPGLYRLPAGARVQDAVLAAGGMLPGVDPASVNLARKLVDGEQLAVGVSPAAGPAAVSGASASSGGPAGPLDLNTATAEQLDALPGVGPVLAQRIVDWRSQHGRFDSVTQLGNVSGIGDAKLADLTPLVTVS